MANEENHTPEQQLIVALDVDYRDTVAVAAGVWFRGWGASTADSEAVTTFHGVADYQPGEFYRRELPCLLGVLAHGPEPEIVVIDGYVWLGDYRPGLGAHLYEALGRKVPVIGVAKTQFTSATQAVPVRRGKSASPLFITSAGVDVAAAAAWIAAMHGPFRSPTLIKRVDQLARTAK